MRLFPLNAVLLSLALGGCQQLSQQVVVPIPPPAPETLCKPLPPELQPYYTLPAPPEPRS